MEAKLCTICGKELKGKQTKFCSGLCKSRDSNNSQQCYAAQKKRAILAKLRLIDSLGGKCSSCGYDKNIASLCFHHRNPAIKKFRLDMRGLANRSSSEIVKEAAKCILLCHNCHTEIHNPELSMSDIRRMDLQPKIKPQSRFCMCGVKIGRSTDKMCQRCYSEHRRLHGRKKTIQNWPSQETLLKSLETKNKTQVARELGVSRRTLSKRIS